MHKSELYRSYSSLEDLITSSQGAESQMSASLRNNIRSVEPQSMLKRVVEVYRNGFLKRRSTALSSCSPVPPKIDVYLAQLISRARDYQDSVRFVEGTNQMEAKVKSMTEPSQTRHVVLSENPNTIPSCCAYSKSGDGFPCLHGLAVIAEKHGTVNAYKFLSRRHLSETWKYQYEDVSFPFPAQCDIDDVTIRAARSVENGENLSIPVAIAPPRGRPPKNIGKRRKNWFEKGPSSSKRSYSCSLCKSRGHNYSSCELRQVFEEEQSTAAPPTNSDV